MLRTSDCLSHHAVALWISSCRLNAPFCLTNGVLLRWKVALRLSFCCHPTTSENWFCSDVWELGYRMLQIVGASLEDLLGSAIRSTGPQVPNAEGVDHNHGAAAGTEHIARYFLQTRVNTEITGRLFLFIFCWSQDNHLMLVSWMRACLWSQDIEEALVFTGVVIHSIARYWNPFTLPSRGPDLWSRLPSPAGCQDANLWSRRPLTNTLVAYAIQSVAHLLKLHQKLLEECDRTTGRYKIVLVVKPACNCSCNGGNKWVWNL